jgi:hypothetical protein
MRQPLLFLEAYHPDDSMGGTPDQIAEYKNVKQQQLQELRSGSYDVVLHSPGIAHPSFSDVPLLFPVRTDFPKPQRCCTISISLSNSSERFSTRHCSAKSSHCSMSVALLFRKLLSRRMATDSDGCR